MSLYNGSVEFAWAHGTIHFRFTYQRLEQLQALKGDDGYLEFIADAIDRRKIAELTELAALASGKKVEDIRLLNPPVLPMASAITVAWQAAWYGADDIPKEAPEKTLPRRGFAFGTRFLPRFGSASAGASSGA